MSQTNEDYKPLPKSDPEQNLPPQAENDQSNEKPSEIMADLKGAIWDLVGTFFFVCCIYYTKGDVTKFIFGFWSILVVFGKVSGSHVNPAISIGLYVYEMKFSEKLPKLAFYIIGQFIGAYLAVLLCSQFYPKPVYVAVPTNKSIFEVFYGECFFTGTFLFVILFVTNEHTAPVKGAPMGCAVIIAWFYVIVQAGSNISGAAYNPAILTVLNVLAYTTTDSKAIQFLFYMISAEILGVIIFALLFKFVFESYYVAKYEKEIKMKKQLEITEREVRNEVNLRMKALK